MTLSFTRIWADNEALEYNEFMQAQIAAALRGDETLDRNTHQDLVRRFVLADDTKIRFTMPLAYRRFRYLAFRNRGPINVAIARRLGLDQFIAIVVRKLPYHDYKQIDTRQSG